MLEINPDIQIIGDYVNTATKIKCRCKIHNIIFDETPGHLLQGEIGCKECAREKSHTSMTKSDQQYKKQVYSINHDVQILNNYDGANTIMYCVCKKCGGIWYPKAHSLLNGFGCPFCKQISRGETAIKNYFQSNNIEYIVHKTFDDLISNQGGKLSYDFYVPSNNLLIEFQGKQHESPVKHFGGYDTFKIQKQHDYIKRQYAIDNNINFLQIWYYDYKNIEQILNQYFKIPQRLTP